MENIAFIDKPYSDKQLTMAQRLELWRASKLQELKPKKGSPSVLQRRNTFALSMMTSPTVPLQDCDNSTGKRDRKAISIKGNTLVSPEHKVQFVASPSPSQELRRPRIQNYNGNWSASPPSPIQTSLSNNSRRLAERSPSTSNILNNSMNGEGYVTAEELNDSEQDVENRFMRKGCSSKKNKPVANDDNQNSSNKLIAKLQLELNGLAAEKKELKNANNHLQVELESMQQQLEIANNNNIELQAKLKSQEELVSMYDARLELSRSDVEAMMFQTSLYEQQIDSLQLNISKDKMNQNESNIKRNKKYKEEYERLEKDKQAYEARANGFIVELQMQIQTLQESAMGRIEVICLYLYFLKDIVYLTF